MTEAEFDKLYYAKNGTALMLERIFKTEKYPEFHAYLDQVHEAWIASMRSRPSEDKS